MMNESAISVGELTSFLLYAAYVGVSFGGMYKYSQTSCQTAKSGKTTKNKVVRERHGTFLFLQNVLESPRFFFKSWNKKSPDLHLKNDGIIISCSR